MESLEVFSANDIKQFLYDYFSQEIDDGNLAWARDMIEGFIPFLSSSPWCKLLEIKIKAEEGKEDLEPRVKALLKEGEKESLDFQMEILDFLTRFGDESLFSAALKKALPLAENEEDLYDLIQLAADFFHFLDDEDREKRVLELSEGRNFMSDKELKEDDRMILAFKSIVFGPR